MTRLQKLLGELDEALRDPSVQIDTGAVLTGDPVVDAWERDLAEGRMPDLSRDKK